MLANVNDPQDTTEIDIEDGITEDFTVSLMKNALEVNTKVEKVHLVIFTQILRITQLLFSYSGNRYWLKNKERVRKNSEEISHSSMGRSSGHHRTIRITTGTEAF